MARETQNPPSSAPTGRLAGLGHRRSQFPLKGEPWKGAAPEAPTAPHATEPLSPPKVKTGPARFWDRRRIRIVASIAMVISLTCHWWAVPFKLWNIDAGVDFKDAGGELGIPIDLIEGDLEEKPEPKTEPQKDPSEDPEKGGGRRDAAPPKIVPEAGVPEPLALDASIGDASDMDGGTDASLIAMGDAGAFPGTAGARDPAAGVGLTEVINAGPQNVVLIINTQLIRTNPVGARMGPVLQQIPQWKDFMRGSQASVDPIRDTDWILIYGPSLIHTDRDAVLIRYNLSDAVVDQAVESIAKTYDKGGPFDAGVPGMKASLGFADNGPRVFLRPQSKLMVIVPPSHAHQFAKSYAKQSPRGPASTEAVRLIVRSPSNQVSIKGLKLEQELKEMRLWVVPRADGSADVYAEGDCTDEAAAIKIATGMTSELGRVNQLGVNLGIFSVTVSKVTKGLLDGAHVDPDGKKVKLHIHATPEQIEAMLQIAAAQVGAQVTPAASTTPP